MSHHEKTANVRLWTSPAPWPRGRHPGDPAAALRAMASALDGAEPPCADEPERYYSGTPQDVQIAQATCRACPALAACGDLAAALGEVHGVWAGVDRSSPHARQQADGRTTTDSTDTTTEESA